MGLYNKVISGLREESDIKELYRFQGSGSFSYFNIKNSRFDKRNSYVYFSKSLDHHKYFMVKRIKQLINKIVLCDSPYRLSLFTLSDPCTFDAIKNLVINDERLPDLYSIRLYSDLNIYNLINNNSFKQNEKMSSEYIEKVDTRVYGGGYGISSEWLDLFSYLTYFNAYKRIDRYDVAEFLNNMRRSGKINRKDNISFITSNTLKYKYKLSPFLESDFTKYKIMEALEQIIDNGLYVKNSELGKKPSETIKKVVLDYEKNKSKILTLFEKSAGI